MVIKNSALIRSSEKHQQKLITGRYLKMTPLNKFSNYSANFAQRGCVKTQDWKFKTKFILNLRLFSSRRSSVFHGKQLQATRQIWSRPSALLLEVLLKAERLRLELFNSQQPAINQSSFYIIYIIIIFWTSFPSKRLIIYYWLFIYFLFVCLLYCLF